MGPVWGQHKQMSVAAAVSVSVGGRRRDAQRRFAARCCWCACRYMLAKGNKFKTKRVLMEAIHKRKSENLREKEMAARKKAALERARIRAAKKEARTRAAPSTA